MHRVVICSNDKTRIVLKFKMPSVIILITVKKIPHSSEMDAALILFCN